MLMSICGSLGMSGYSSQTCMSRQRLTFPDEEFSMAIHDAGMFNVKEINRIKILQDVIDRNLRPGQAAEMLGITPRHCSRLLKRYRQLGPLVYYRSGQWICRRIHCGLQPTLCQSALA
ncbi:helix-turn-helix domain-containing protein [Klebsiella pneumoniae]|uniref:helix-turn-helix domain-containing protein n=2 Tax=Klebsiella/Raoultella group TaxID=2890311 RepID=UPI003DA77C5D